MKKLNPHELHQLVVLLKTGAIEIEKENIDKLLSDYTKSDAKILKKAINNKLKNP